MASMNSLARVLSSQGRYKAAEWMHQQTLELNEKKIMLKKTAL